MTDSSNAHGYGSLLNFVPMEVDGYAIELCPVSKGEDVHWCWSARLGATVRRCLSDRSFASRADAFADASDWWKKYSEYVTPN